MGPHHIFLITNAPTVTRIILAPLHGTLTNLRVACSTKIVDQLLQLLGGDDIHHGVRVVLDRVDEALRVLLSGTKTLNQVLQLLGTNNIEKRLGVILGSVNKALGVLYMVTAQDTGADRVARSSCKVAQQLQFLGADNIHHCLRVVFDRVDERRGVGLDGIDSGDAGCGWDGGGRDGVETRYG